MRLCSRCDKPATMHHVRAFANLTGTYDDDRCDDHMSAWPGTPIKKEGQ